MGNGGAEERLIDIGKLTEIQSLARSLDDALKAEFGLEQLGGELLLGKHYAVSNRIFLGLNPGGEGAGLNVDALDFNFWDRPEPGYWQNCSAWVKSAEGLHQWITPSTASFCCPWRTENGSELHRLNRLTRGKLLEYSGKLVQKLVEHHRGPDQAVALVVAGRASLYLLCQLLNSDWRPAQTFHNGRSRTYQWSNNKIEWRDINITVYQVPHFSRANSKPLLCACARWLASDLGLRANTSPETAAPDR